VTEHPHDRADSAPRALTGLPTPSAAAVEAAARWLKRRMGDPDAHAIQIAIIDAENAWTNAIGESLIGMGFEREAIAARVSASTGSTTLPINCFRLSQPGEVQIQFFTSAVDASDPAALALLPLYAAADALLWCVPFNGQHAEAQAATLESLLSGEEARNKAAWLVHAQPLVALPPTLQAIVATHEARVALFQSNTDTPTETMGFVFAELDRRADEFMPNHVALAASVDESANAEPASIIDAAQVSALAEHSHEIAATSDTPVPNSAATPVATAPDAIPAAAASVSLDQQIENTLFEHLVRTQARYVSVVSKDETLMFASDDELDDALWLEQDEMLRFQINAISLSALRTLTTVSEGLLRSVSAIDGMPDLVIHCVWVQENLHDVVAAAYARDVAGKVAALFNDNKK
jgi:hypothetical protein